VNAEGRRNGAALRRQRIYWSAPPEMGRSTRPLGTSGLSVTPLCLGTMMFGAWGATTEADCARILHAALDAGINTIDVADIYAFGEAEEFVGRALRSRRDD